MIEVKWALVAMVIIFITAIIGVTVDSYKDYDCRIAYANSNKTAEEVAKICK